MARSWRRTSAWLVDTPQAAVCVWALAAGTEEEAWRLFASRERARQVRDRLVALAADLEVDELAVITWTWDFEAQKRSYSLLAEAFG